MKKPRRFVPILAVAALLTAGCGKTEAPPPNTPAFLMDGNTIVVIVTYDEVTKKAEMSQQDKALKIKKGVHTVQWLSPAGIVTVSNWVNVASGTSESPWLNEPKHEKKILKSGHAKTKGSFEYKAWLELCSNPGNLIQIDPRIEVMD